MQEREFNPQRAGLGTVAAIEAYFRREWAAVVQKSGSPSSPDLLFLSLAARLESGQADESDLREYRSLEAEFRGLAPYYLHLLHYYQKKPQVISRSEMTALGEKVVSGCPQGPVATEPSTFFAPSTLSVPKSPGN